MRCMLLLPRPVKTEWSIHLGGGGGCMDDLRDGGTGGWCFLPHHPPPLLLSFLPPTPLSPLCEFFIFPSLLLLKYCSLTLDQCSISRMFVLSPLYLRMYLCYISSYWIALLLILDVSICCSCLCWIGLRFFFNQKNKHNRTKKSSPSASNWARKKRISL